MLRDVQVDAIYVLLKWEEGDVYVILSGFNLSFVFLCVVKQQIKPVITRPNLTSLCLDADEKYKVFNLHNACSNY